MVPVVAYVCSALLLILPFGAHPNFPYNWEDYALTRLFDFWDHPGLWILQIDAGLMTNSGQSPLLAIPVWLAWKLEGVGLATMRFPLMLISAAAIPLLWLVGKRIAGPLEGGLAAALLALSPVFLFYGRTATNVALSLVPALLTIYALLGLLRKPGSVWQIAALQLLLVVGVYAYAPIRFLWPMAIGLIALEIVLRPRLRRAFISALAVTSVVLPLFLIAATGRTPGAALSHYYWGRGEHLLALREHPANLRSHMQEEISENPELASAATSTLVRHKLVQNVQDLLNLLIDRNTRPALTDYWNPHGRLYPLVLVPFLLAGLIVCAARAARSPEYRAILGLAAGFTFPIVLTSNVHIGRLIFALPLLLLIAAIGFCWTARKLLAYTRQSRQVQTAGLIVASCALVILFGWLSWQEYHGYTAPTRTWPWTRTLEASAQTLQKTGGAAAYATDNDAAFEEIEIATMRLTLDGDFTFIDRREAGFDPTDLDKIPLYYGQLLAPGALLSIGDQRCDLHYFTTTEVAGQLVLSLIRGPSPCPELPKFTVLDPE